MNNKQTTIYKRILSSLFIVYCLLFIAPNFSSAVCTTTPNSQLTEYCLLSPLPLDGLDKAPTEKATAATFLPGIFKLVIGIAGLLAVVRLMYAGILYMTNDAWDQKSSAKNIIWDALSGLILAISAWVILNTINPKLVELNLNIPQIKIEDTTGGGGVEGGGGKKLPGYSLTQAQIEENNTLRGNLLKGNPPVRVNNDPCTNPSITEGCTNVVGLPPSAISGVVSFAVACKEVMKTDCNVIINGGAEGGHQTHGPGKSKVDIDDTINVNKYIETKGAEIKPKINACSMLGPQYRLNGNIYVNEGNHWHVCY